MATLLLHSYPQEGQYLEEHVLIGSLPKIASLAPGAYGSETDPVGKGSQGQRKRMQSEAAALGVDKSQASVFTHLMDLQVQQNSLVSKPVCGAAWLTVLRYTTKQQPRALRWTASCQICCPRDDTRLGAAAAHARPMYGTRRDS